MTGEKDLSTLGASSGGVWTRGQALAVVSADVLRGHLYDGTWRRLLPGTYTDGGFEPDAAIWGWAVLLSAGEQSVLCGRSAARVWGLPLIDDDDPATSAHEADDHDVAVVHHRGARTWAPAGSSAGGVVHRRQLSLSRDDVVLHASGMRVTTAVRTLRDLAAVVAPDALVCAVDHALHAGLVTAQALAGEALRARGSRQAPAFRLALEQSDAGAESPAETLARLLLRPHLPGLRTQVRVLQAWGEVIARFDLADEELLLAVEADGKRGHAGRQMVARDRRRDRRTEALGWHTERVTWFELRRQQSAVVRRVTALALRRAHAA